MILHFVNLIYLYDNPIESIIILNSKYLYLLLKHC